MGKIRNYFYLNIQPINNFHITQMVRDIKYIITTFKIGQSVTAPYKENLPV